MTVFFLGFPFYSTIGKVGQIDIEFFRFLESDGTQPDTIVSLSTKNESSRHGIISIEMGIDLHNLIGRNIWVKLGFDESKNAISLESEEYNFELDEYGLRKRLDSLEGGYFERTGGK